MTINMGMSWCAAVQRDPGVYRRSPSFWMLTQTLPVPLNASATPIATPIPVPVPPPPAMYRAPSRTSQSLRSQPLSDPCARTQSWSRIVSQISADSRAVAMGFCDHQRSFRSFWTRVATGRVDLPSFGGSLGDPALQIAVQCALAQTSELPQHRRSAPENGDIRGHEPAVTAGPALDPILLQTDTNELGPLPDDALV